MSLFKGVMISSLIILFFDWAHPANDMQSLALALAKTDSENALWIKYFEAKQRIAEWDLKEIEQSLQSSQVNKKNVVSKNIQKDLTFTKKIEKKIPEIESFRLDCVDDVDVTDFNRENPIFKKCAQMVKQLLIKFRSVENKFEN